MLVTSPTCFLLLLHPTLITIFNSFTSFLLSYKTKKMALKVEQADTAGDTTGNTTSRRSSSIYLEKISSLNFTATEEESAIFERPISGWAWALVCIGLFLGSLLYGKFFQSNL
jgi:hypothetical protein